MPRLHTRRKRRLNLITSRKHRFLNTKRKNRPKTFKTEEKAKEYALNVLKLKEGSFSIVPAKRNKKFKIK